MESRENQERKLRKPACINFIKMFDNKILVLKVNEIKPDKTGYNVYLKVYSIYITIFKSTC